MVIGDVVGSRRTPDRVGLHGRLRAALEAINARHGSDLRITVGDEYQGHFPSLGAALAGVWRLRLELLPDADVRHGIGLGDTAVLDAESGDRIEDGPGWWAAREAIEAVEQAASRPRSKAVRDRLSVAADSTRDPGVVAAINAALTGRDALTGRLDARSVSVLCGLLDGRSQVAVAAAQGITASAVSQRIRQDGLGALVDMTAELEGIS